MESLPLFINNKERKIFYAALCFLFSLNLLLEYKDYRQFIAIEVHHTKGTILNIYPKNSYDIAKISAQNKIFFTNIEKNSLFKNFDTITLYIVSTHINFYEYIKGMYLKSFGISKQNSPPQLKETLYNFIDQQHTNPQITSLYAALFLATPLTPTIRELSANLGISHLIAISGFHLGVMSFVLYTLFHLLYASVHKKYFPYRNKKYDLSLLIACVLLGYLIFLDYPPSLLRAFVMLLFALFLVRNNIKLISFETLFIISCIIIALFPSLLFSLSLWFSIIGVFYIFLYMQYFSYLNKYIQFFLFNFWLYFVMNPITHFFFGTTSLEQIYSPLLTILFTLFYPISVLMHLINYGDILDGVLQLLIELEIKSIEIVSSSWIFYFYIFLSLGSIKSKHIFILLNTVMTLYTFWLFSFFL